MRGIARYLLLFPLLLVFSCGDSGSQKVSKGHREAIKLQCKEAKDVKACGLEVRRNFIEDGNEYATLEEPESGAVKKIKFECMRTKSFGLESYNNCLEEHVQLWKDGDLWNKTIPQTPRTHIGSLEQQTVVVEILYETQAGQLMSGGAGSGVILKDNLIATNCHVTNSYHELSKNYKLA